MRWNEVFMAVSHVDDGRKWNHYGRQRMLMVPPSKAVSGVPRNPLSKWHLGGIHKKKHMFLTNPELLYGKTPGWCNPHESHVVASFFSISLWYSHMLSPYYIIYPHKMVAQSFIITMVMRCNKITRASILIQGIQGIQGALFVKHCTAWGQAEQGCSQQLLVWVVNGVKI